MDLRLPVRAVREGIVGQVTHKRLAHPFCYGNIGTLQQLQYLQRVNARYINRIITGNRRNGFHLKLRRFNCKN
ncbi:hypothetical protein D3C73_1518260 [compost metagenome]